MPTKYNAYDVHIASKADPTARYVKYEDYQELVCELEGAGVVGYMCPACLCAHNHAPADLPTAEDLAQVYWVGRDDGTIFNNIRPICKKQTIQGINAILNKLAPYLGKPVPCAECAKWEAYAVRLQNDCEDYSGRINRARAALEATP